MKVVKLLKVDRAKLKKSPRSPLVFHCWLLTSVNYVLVFSVAMFCTFCRLTRALGCYREFSVRVEAFARVGASRCRSSSRNDFQVD